LPDAADGEFPDQAAHLIFDKTEVGQLAIPDDAIDDCPGAKLGKFWRFGPMLLDLDQNSLTVRQRLEKLEDKDHVSPPISHKFTFVSGPGVGTAK
jgi:hypothetical protein